MKGVLLIMAAVPNLCLLGAKFQNPPILLHINPSRPELNTSAQHCLLRFFTRDFIFKGLAVGHLYKLFGVNG
jgi:hypothetical protein